MEQTEDKKEPINQAGIVKNIFAPDENKARISDETNTSNLFEVHPGKINTNQIGILNGRAGGWLLC